jgi:hypothetical protein
MTNRLPSFLGLALLGLSLPFAAAAQTTAPAPADTARFYRHHLGLTASPVLNGFFRNNRSLPLGLLYKRQLTPRKAWRFGVVGDQQYEERYAPFPKTNNAYATLRYRVEAAVGLEVQKWLARRWMSFAGADAGAGYSHYRYDKHTERFVTMNGADVVLAERGRSIDKAYSGFLRPFLGIRYHLLPYLYVSAESTLSVSYTLSKADFGSVVSRTDTGEVTNTSHGEYKERQFRTALLPVSRLGIHYVFGKANP